MSISLTIADVIKCPPPDAVNLRGLVGKRCNLSRLNRLRHQEQDHLLWPFHEPCPVGRPDRPDKPHPEINGDWQGEYIGTWLDAAVLSAWNADDKRLQTKIDAMVMEWLSTQHPDGYLGTYPEQDRWKSWDVWVQAHDIIGLLSYYRYTGSPKALGAAVGVADRVLQDFGPGKRYLYATDPHHGGMVPSSILEPLIWLYGETGRNEYLEWCRWLVDEDWEQPGGPKIISSLMVGRGVAGTANAKGIEMLICFAGLVELYRATGDDHYLKPVLVAWDDIVRYHLYITGSASTGERFTTDYSLRNDGVYKVGETCVSMGWLYLNLKLGRLLGEARFFDMAEQVLYNHLLAAQSPDGRGWAYYVGLRDSKRYRWHIDPECCPTRGVRALALMPPHAFGIDNDGIVINLYEAAEGTIDLTTTARVGIKLASNYPFDGRTHLALGLKEATTFALRLRLPGWCQSWDLRVNGEQEVIEPDDTGYLAIKRTWYNGDEIQYDMDMPVNIVADELGNPGLVAVVRGPLVFAADNAYLPKGMLLDDVVLSINHANHETRVRVVNNKELGSVHLRVPTVLEKPKMGTRWWRVPARYRCVVDGHPSDNPGEIELVPFFEAGNRDDLDSYKDGFWTSNERVATITYKVWLPYRFG